jgi:hypothetical protein
VSTGAGPLTVYEPLSGSTRKSTQGMTPKQVERLQQVDAAARRFAELENLHRQEFSEPVREVVAGAKLPKFAKLVATAEKQTLRGVSPFNREARRARKVEARHLAERWALDLMTLAESERQSQQDRVDQEWDALHHNDPVAVMRALAATYGGDQHPVRVVGVEGGEVHVILRVDGPEVLPESKPATTRSGAATLNKLNKTDRAAWHRQLVASQVLLTAKKAMAAAPGLSAVRIVGVDHADAPLLGARLTRAGLRTADWNADAWGILARLDGELRCDLRGRTKELVTLDLRNDEAFGSLVGG